jgi:hypothetical protein
MSYNNKNGGDDKNNASSDCNNKFPSFMPVKFFAAKLWV